MRRGQRVWIWWGDGVAWAVKFVRWARVTVPGTKRRGVGALVFDELLFRGVLRTYRERGGLPPGFGKLNPYAPIYTSDPRKTGGTIKRPPFRSVGPVRPEDFRRIGLTT